MIDITKIESLNITFAALALFFSLSESDDDDKESLSVMNSLLLYLVGVVLLVGGLGLREVLVFEILAFLQYSSLANNYFFDRYIKHKLLNNAESLTNPKGVPRGGGRWVRAPPLKYKLIYISSQRNSGNRTSEDAMTFFGLHLILGGKLDVEKREDLFYLVFT